MKRNIIIKGIVLFILMAACVFRFETDLMAAGAAGVVTISVEKFTIGQGYLVDPATVPITEGQSVADVLIPLLKNNGYEPEIATGAMYYLAGILKADNGNYKVPAIIGTMGGMTSSSGSGLTPPDGTEKKKYMPARVTLKSVKPGKKQAVLTWKKIREATGYQVFLSAKKSSGFKKTATIRKAKTVTFKKKKLKSKKTYYFRVRAYRTVGKTTWYGPYSAVKKAKIK